MHNWRVFAKQVQLKPHDSTGLTSSSTLYMAVVKLPQVLKEKWWFYVDDKD